MATADRPNIPIGDASPNYVDRRSKELLKRYRGTRERRQKKAEELAEASQYQLMLAQFKKHRVAWVCLYLLALLYIISIFASFVAPYDKLQRFEEFTYAKPSQVRLVDADGNWHLPFIYGRTRQLDKKTFTYTFTEDPSKRYPIHLFATGEPYQLLGVIPTNRHLLGVEGDQPFFLLGSDKLGRDLFSRIIHASRVSLFIGFAGVIISFVLGILPGRDFRLLRRPGRYGHSADHRVPHEHPPDTALDGIIGRDPARMDGIQKFLAITIVLSFVGWTGLARVVRGKLISLREEDYVMAAHISSAKPMQIIVRHLLPGVTSFLVVSITLAIPGMILGETTLSFLGLGITAPDVSWGSLLQDAQDVNVIANYPWLLAPVGFIMLAVVLFNFVGDGLRDAADPYSR